MMMQGAVAIFEAMPDKEKRKWEAERRIIRQGINKCRSIARRDRECLMYCCNLWFYHRNGDGFIRPGASLIAEKLECSVRTAKTCLKNLRDGGYLIPVAYAKGGRNATRYAVDLGKIRDDMCRKPRFDNGEWDEIKGRSRAHINRAKMAANRAKVAHGNIKVASEKPLPEAFGDPSDWSEVPF